MNKRTQHLSVLALMALFAVSITAAIHGYSQRVTWARGSYKSVPEFARGIRRGRADVPTASAVTVSFAGDCTFGTVNGDNGPSRFPAVAKRSGLADYPFALVRPWFRKDDLTLVNFECTLTNSKKLANKQWHFKGDAHYASLFRQGSIEAVSLANNHSFDYMQKGFDDTLRNFSNAGEPVFYQNRPYVTKVKGVEAVIIGDCTVVGENTTVIGQAPERVLKEIKRYKKPGNIVVVFMHWGSELDVTPRSWQTRLGRAFVDAGADAVVGCHPHVLQGIEVYKGKCIAYSLGNFAFGGNSLARHPDTVILQLRFHEVNGVTESGFPSVVPCRTTSSTARNRFGVLRNNYQPTPVYGRSAARTVNLILKRNAGLEYGVKTLPVSG